MAEPPKHQLGRGNHKLDENVRKLGYCCPLAFLRINILPTDTEKKMAEKAGVSDRCIRLQHAKMRKGLNKCPKRDTCLRAMWMSPGQMRQEDKERTATAPIEGPSAVGASVGFAVRRKRGNRKRKANQEEVKMELGSSAGGVPPSEEPDGST